MNLIIKGAMVCATCFVGGVAALIWLVLDVAFKAIRLMRYGFLKFASFIASACSLSTHDKDSCNKILDSISEEDVTYAAKVDMLKL